MKNEDVDKHKIFEEEELQSESLKEANISQEELYLIYKDYIENGNVLREQAEYYGNTLHWGKEINSVKWRLKDPIHLLTKIIRKRKEAIKNKENNEESEKDNLYLSINVSNYKSIINDLVGIRAIYLFKKNWSSVNKFVLNNFSVSKDEIIIYHTDDDDLDFYPEDDEVIDEYKYKRIERKSRYRSTHYLIQSIPPHDFKFELQTRTILDEAWGEIDHHVRYPDFEHDPELKRKMSVLNGAISGCEEMTSRFFEDYEELKEIKKNSLKSKYSVENQAEAEAELENGEQDKEQCIKSDVLGKNEAWDEAVSKLARLREMSRMLDYPSDFNAGINNTPYFRIMTKALEKYHSPEKNALNIASEVFERFQANKDNKDDKDDKDNNK